MAAVGFVGADELLSLRSSSKRSCWQRQGDQGTDVEILKIFSPKNLAKTLAFFGSNYC
jgi:hypothetical protein